MAIDFLLQTYVSHVSSVIVWLIVGCLGLIALYLLLSLREEKLQIEGGQANFTQLEETLKKVLESTSGIGGKEAAQKLVAPTLAPEVSTVDTARIAAEIEAKSKLLSELENKLAEAKVAASLAPAAAPIAPVGAADTSGLEAKLKNLEAKLAEYQVVEDDIANLSLYREENVRLKDEIERLKAGGPAAATAEAPAAPAVDDGVAEFEAALKAQEADAPPTPALVPTEAASPIEDDLMAEFEAIVRSQKQQEQSASSNAEISRAVEAPIDQDVMGDFESAVRQSEPVKEKSVPPILAVVPPPAAPVAEVASLPTAVAPAVAAPSIVAAPAVAPTPTHPPPAHVPPALALQLDTDQMVSEINNYQAPAGPATSEISEGDRLIAEFENFVKKEGESS